ncbi:MAG: hypothetical protein II768_01330 [Clostridia bacterium]|nr:hypothetical protein [Clostridia bacterium]
MIRYSIMSLNYPEHAEEIARDIEAQYRDRVADCALFCMTLVPEGTPPVDKAAILSEKYDVFRDRLAERGLSCGILIQASIGHGYPLDRPFPFQCYVNLSDGAEQSVCCPADPDFRAFFRSQTRTLAMHRPAVIMLDDDFRLMTARAGRGCACPRHMAEFNRRAGLSLTREELARRIDREPELGRIFAEVQRDSLLGAVREFRAGIDEIDRHIPGVFCVCGGEYGAEIARIFAGEGSPVVVRLNNGNYTAAGARGLSQAMLRAAYQIATMNGPVDAVLAETDTCPQNRYSTGAMSLHSHFTGTILEGASGAKHWITRLGAYEPESGRAYRKILAKYAGFYEAIAELVPTLSPLGCRIPMPTAWKTPYEPEYPGTGWATCVLERLGFPLYFSSKPGGAVFLEGAMDSAYTDDELRKMLSGTVFLSGEAAARLVGRGFAEDLGVTVRPWTGKHPSGELLAESGNPVNTQVRAMELVPLSDDVKIHSTVYHVPDGRTREPLFPGVTSYRNARGGYVVVFCGDPHTNFNYIEAFSFLNESRKAQMAGMLAEARHLPVYYPGDAEVYLRAARMPDGGLFVAFFNIGLDPLDEVTLVTEENVISVERLTPDGRREACRFTRDGNILTVDCPANTLDPVVLFLGTERAGG